MNGAKMIKEEEFEPCPECGEDLTDPDFCDECGWPVFHDDAVTEITAEDCPIGIAPP